MELSAYQITQITHNKNKVITRLRVKLIKEVKQVARDILKGYS